MQVVEMTNGSGVSRLRGRTARSRSIGTKLTPEEEEKVLAAAEAAGKAPSEWVRDVIVREVREEAEERIAMHAFTELVGLELLVMNALQPLVSGQKMGADQFQKLVEQVQASKQTKARELLARRGLKEKSSHD
ncbi:MAG: hypothetical protein ACLGRW_09355 [Acidobacteriota bacterium]